MHDDPVSLDSHVDGIRTIQDGLPFIANRLASGQNLRMAREMSRSDGKKLNVNHILQLVWQAEEAFRVIVGFLQGSDIVLLEAVEAFFGGRTHGKASGVRQADEICFALLGVGRHGQIGGGRVSAQPEGHDICHER